MTVLDGRIVHEAGPEPAGAPGPVGPPRACCQRPGNPL
jgi:hypothetical protein